MNTIVLNPYQFLDHFEKNDQLTLTPGQSLVVSDLTEIYSPMERREKEPEEIAQKVVNFLSHIVNPLGKSITFTLTPDATDFTGDNHSIRVDTKIAFTLQAESTSLCRRFLDLCHWMIRSGHMKLQITAPQSFTIRQIRQEEINAISRMKSVEEIIGHVLPTRAPFGFRAQFNFTPEAQTVEYESLTMPDGTYLRGWVEIKPQDTMKFSLEPAPPIYHFPSFAYFRAFLLYQKLVVPPNQTLSIEDPEMSKIWKQKQNYPGKNELSLFEEMFLAYGKAIKITPGPSGYNWKLEGNRLEIHSTEGFEIALSSEGLVTTFPILARSLINANVSALKLAPNQELFLTNIDWEDVEEWAGSTDMQSVMKGLKRLLLKHSHLGYTWSLSLVEDNLDYLWFKHRGKDETEHSILRLKSSGGIRLELDLADADTLAYQILQEGGKPLQEAIKEFDADALVLCQFKALFFFCCQDFRNSRAEDTWPSFFKEGTNRALSSLLQEGSEFNKAFLQIVENTEYLDQLLKINRMTPQEFDEMDLGKVHPLVKSVVTELLALTHFEMRGGTFVKVFTKQAERF